MEIIEGQITDVPDSSERNQDQKYFPGKKKKKKQFDLMWQFLQFGQQKSNIPLLKELCESLRHMMMQKTAGQRKDKKDDIPFDDLSTVLCGIVIEAMCLYLSGDLDNLKQQEEEDD